MTDHSLYRKNWKLINRYGITSVDYDKMIEDQKNCCKICNKESKLHVDHCHKTGRVRGLLCYACNNGLGCFKDNKELLSCAIEYLNG